MAHKKEIVYKPILTEKMVRYQEDENKYAFVVNRDANKLEIKKAVEEKFQVVVNKVNVMNYTGKMKRQGRTMGRRPSWKKAIVTLREGDKIEVVEGL